MGLDIYLYRYEDYAAVTAKEDAAGRFSAEAWERHGKNKTYEQMTEGERAAARAEVEAWNAEHGLGKWGEVEDGKAKIEINSAKYPEHVCKIGYLRSSYNDGGFERVAGQLVGMTWADVFLPNDYCVQPDWAAARERAAELLMKLRSAKPLRVATVSHSIFGGMAKADARTALSLVAKEREQERHPDFSSYSNRDGTFFLGKPLPIIAAIPGTAVLGEPCVHLVYEPEDFDWYLQAAEISVEMIDYVLAQPDVEKYWLHWSS